MTKREILQRIVEKIKHQYALNLAVSTNYIDWMIERADVNTIILTHDFAKALWGEERMWTGKFEFEQWEMSDGRLNDGEYSKIENYCWEYHLKQMVILSNNGKFEYLEKFL